MVKRLIGISIATAALIGVVASAARIGGRLDAAASKEPDTVGPRVVVVAELFTSEGCSSCPPADTLLRKLIAAQPVDGVEVVALGEHVDYWDSLGWRDPFSSPTFSARQSAYDAAVFHTNNVYTPQLVVDGVLQGVASNEAGVRRLLQSAARSPRGTLTLATTPAASAVSVTVQLDMPSTVTRKGPADIVVAVTEDGLTTHVKNGENGGRTLAHSAVVRTFTTVGHLGVNETSMRTTGVVALNAEWARSHLRLVAFAQEQGSRRMLAAAAASMQTTGTD